MRTRFDEPVVRSYWSLLTSIEWSNDLLVRGLREGLNKFLSNAWLSVVPGSNKYHKTHLISAAALDTLHRRTSVGLCFEHIVPKQKYIQQPCIDRAKTGTLTLEFVRERFQQYWALATVTAGEDALLRRVSMPDDWDNEDLLARYREADLDLHENPFFPK